MTDGATRKPWLTPRRVVAGAVLAVLVLTVAGFVFRAFDGDQAGAVKVTFAGFSNSADGKFTLAGLVLKTRSSKVGIPLFIPPAKPVGFDPLLRARFRTSSPTGDVLWTGSQDFSNRNLVVFMGPQDETDKAPLPQDGRTGKLEIAYEVEQSRFPVYLRDLLDRFVIQFDEPMVERWAVCDQEIQCPKILADGTAEPPRLVPAKETKR